MKKPQKTYAATIIDLPGNLSDIIGLRKKETYVLHEPDIKDLHERSVASEFEEQKFDYNNIDLEAIKEKYNQIIRKISLENILWFCYLINNSGVDNILIPVVKAFRSENRSILMIPLSDENSKVLYYYGDSWNTHSIIMISDVLDVYRLMSYFYRQYLLHIIEYGYNHDCKIKIYYKDTIMQVISIKNGLVILPVFDYILRTSHDLVHCLYNKYANAEDGRCVLEVQETLTTEMGDIGNIANLLRFIFIIEKFVDTDIVKNEQFMEKFSRLWYHMYINKYNSEVKKEIYIAEIIKSIENTIKDIIKNNKNKQYQDLEVDLLNSVVIPLQLFYTDTNEDFETIEKDINIVFE